MEKILIQSELLRILYTVTYESLEFFSVCNVYYMFAGLLYILQVMHIIWFYMILRIAYNAITKGKVEDERSESGESQHEHKQ